MSNQRENNLYSHQADSPGVPALLAHPHLAHDRNAGDDERRPGLLHRRGRAHGAAVLVHAAELGKSPDVVLAAGLLGIRPRMVVQELNEKSCRLR